MHRVPVVLLILHLAAGKRNVTGIDDDDEVPTVGVGAEEGLVLPPEDGGDLTGEAADDLWRREGREGRGGSEI